MRSFMRLSLYARRSRRDFRPCHRNTHQFKALNENIGQPSSPIMSLFKQKATTLLCVYNFTEASSKIWKNYDRNLYMLLFKYSYKPTCYYGFFYTLIYSCISECMIFSGPVVPEIKLFYSIHLTQADTVCD